MAVNHADPAESQAFRALALHLFSWDKQPVDVPTDQIAFSGRTQLYERLVDYFPSDAKQPKTNLVDLVPMI